MFLNQLLSNGISINDDILLSKAKEFACFFPEIAKDGFRFSHGCLCNFKQRFNIKQYTKHGEANSVSEEDIIRRR